MAEHKPKRDKRVAGDAPHKAPRPSRETKPHGDKLQTALDAISDALEEAQRRDRKTLH